jgi:hypothetical protein
MTGRILLAGEPHAAITRTAALSPTHTNFLVGRTGEIGINTLVNTEHLNRVRFTVFILTPATRGLFRVVWPIVAAGYVGFSSI